MKFIVTHGPLNETNVTMPYETKDRIKRFGAWTAASAAAVVIVLGVTAKKPSTEEPSE